MINLSNVAHGYSLIERHDVRVGRVDISRDDFQRLRSESKTDRQNPSLSDAWLSLDFVPQNADSSFVGHLFGSELYVRGNRTVLYPEGWVEGERWRNLSAPQPNIDGHPKTYTRVVKPVVMTELGFHDMNAMTGLGLVINTRTHCRPVGKESAEEQIAQEALREQITEDEWRRYMRTGFLCVRGSSGMVYQIERIATHVSVWKGGTKVAAICSYIKDRAVPPTDKVLAFKTIVETDEQELWRRGNVYKFA